MLLASLAIFCQLSAQDTDMQTIVQGALQNQADSLASLAKMEVTDALKQEIWDTYRALPDPALKEQFEKNIVKTNYREAKYKWRTVGSQPKEGWGLVIAMHGGGGVPQEVNDREWEYMWKGYYADQPDLPGYIYLALRAPNDNWNGFYDDPIAPMIERLIWQFVKFANVDPNRIYATGASHGGYGVFVIGPKLADRFAALHAAAAAPSDGETRGVNLRNVNFTWAVGENDTAYGRVDRCKAFAQQFADWRKQYGGFYGGLELQKGKGHLINDYEHNRLRGMLRHKRNPFPQHIIWQQTGTLISRQYLLHTPASDGTADMKLDIYGQTITIKGKQEQIDLWLRPEYLDLTQPVTLIWNGKQVYQGKVPTDASLYLKTLDMVHDPQLAAATIMSITSKGITFRKSNELSSQ